jgi:hypothetical protein
VHNWGDQNATKILSELRKVASPDTRLVVYDAIIAHACHDPNNDDMDAPVPLLPNFGVAGEIKYTVDMAVSCHFDRNLLSTYGTVAYVGRC